MSQRLESASSIIGPVGATLLVASLAFGFAAVEPPGYPDSTDTPCGRVFLAPQRSGECSHLMARRSAWVVGLGVPGALALLIPSAMREGRSTQRRALALAVGGAVLGYGIVALIDHFTSSPIPLFGASAGAILFPGLYLAFAR